MTIMGLVAGIAGLMELAFLQSGGRRRGRAGFHRLGHHRRHGAGGNSDSVAGGILGALLIAVIRNGLVLLELSACWGTVVTGAVIIAAVAIGA